MKQESVVGTAIECGIPSQTSWVLPGGFGSAVLSPEAQELPKNIGEVNNCEFSLRPGLVVYTFDAKIRSPVKFSYDVLTGKPYLWLALNFSGNSEYKHGGSVSGVAPADWSFCAMLRDQKSDLLNSAGNHRAAGMVVTQNRLEDMLFGQHLCGPIADFVKSNFDSRVIASRPTPALRTIANQMFCHPYQGVMESVFLEAKAFEMLAESLRILIDESHLSGTGRERRFAMAARDIMMADLANPPRIEDVAKMVGLSHRRLNEVFREVFDASPLQCLVGWRLDLARQLLIAGELTVKQVANKAGYAHVSNFSLAFSRRFGHPPTGTRGS